MASTPVPLTFATATVAASGTSVAPSAPVPDNCHTILVTNPDTVKVGLVGLGTAGGALVAGTSAQRVPPGVTLVLAVGPAGLRAIMDQSQVAGSGLIYDSIGGALVLEITHLNGVGGAGA